MNNYTTYTVKAKTSADVWVFKYHLNGILYQFTVLDGQLSKTQVEWLFVKGNFPYLEHTIGDWHKLLKKNFTIEKGLPDTTFNSFWDTYGKKVHKMRAEKEWKKLSEAMRIKALEGLRRYNNYLRLNTWRSKTDADNYLKGKMWEDEF